MAAEIRVGASSWTSEAWWDRVYPRDLAPGERLRWYSRLHDCVEVDSTYYSVPPRTMVRGWEEKTPGGFLFTLKFPREFLDPKKKVDAGKLDAFYSHAKLLGPKLGCVLLQFAPWVKPGRANESIEELLDQIDPTIPHAIELRDKGWFAGETKRKLLADLRERGISFTWSYLTYVDVPAEVTTDTIYMRFIGDHETIPAETHGEVRLDRTKELKEWITKLEKHRDEVKQILVFFNNHFAGYAPASINQFRRMLGMAEVDFERAINEAGTAEPGPRAQRSGKVPKDPGRSLTIRLDRFG